MPVHKEKQSADDSPSGSDHQIISADQQDEDLNVVETNLRTFSLHDPMTVVMGDPRYIGEEISERAPDFPLVKKITITEAFLTSELIIHSGNSHYAFELINAAIETVDSDQLPPNLMHSPHPVEASTSKTSCSVGSSSTVTPHFACARCRHTPRVTAAAKVIYLFRCSNCNCIEYCCKPCQFSDWMAHKNTYCVNPFNIPVKSLAEPTKVPFFKTHIVNPFSRLERGIWLQDRHKLDVYALLIDSFRLREYDDFLYESIINNESVYNGRDNSCPVFCRFLDQAEAKKLLPKWWSDEKRVECLKMGLDRSNDNYHDLYATTKDLEILVVYGNPMMLLQLRLFAESVYGIGPAGTNGRFFKQMMVAAEDRARKATKE